MRQKRVMAVAAVTGLAALATYVPTLADRPAAATFDPLFAGGTSCAPPQAGRPALLGRLLLAQAETKPFVPGQQSSKPAGAGIPPLYKDLGTHHVAITTTNPRAQAYFDQGMRLTYGFNHAEAARAFRAAQQLDPTCAMCFWGEALVLGPNINAPMFPDAAAPAAAAAARAVQLSARATPPEQALIRAVARRSTVRMPTPWPMSRVPFPTTTRSRCCSPNR